MANLILTTEDDDYDIADDCSNACQMSEVMGPVLNMCYLLVLEQTT